MPVWSIVDQLLYNTIPPEVLLQMFDVTMIRNVCLSSMLIIILSTYFPIPLVSPSFDTTVHIYFKVPSVK